MNNNQYKPLTSRHIWFLNTGYSLTGIEAQEFLEQQLPFIRHTFSDAYSLEHRICSDLDSYVQSDNLITDTDELLELLSRISVYCSMFLSGYEQMKASIDELTDNYMQGHF